MQNTYIYMYIYAFLYFLLLRIQTDKGEQAQNAA